MRVTTTCSLALSVALLAAMPSALACGGGGSGSYRKPQRPGQHQHQQATVGPTADKDSTPAPVAPQ